MAQPITIAHNQNHTFATQLQFSNRRSLSVWLLDETTQLGIFEAGISQPGEMEALRDIIQPTIGVMVSLGSAHQENFGSMEEKMPREIASVQRL